MFIYLMKTKHKSFPKLQIFSFFILFMLLACSTEEKEIINEHKFIEVYARLMIINEADINKKDHPRLVEELLRKYQVESEQIRNTLEYYNNNPDKWANILRQIRDRIKELRNNPDIVRQSAF